jgi:predicted NUDIX family NTP pyrophosphohydrolase
MVDSSRDTPGRRGNGGLVSAGLLMYRMCRRAEGAGKAAPGGSGEPGFEVLLVHPGGPFFVRRDEGAWTIPKGLVGEGEDLEAAAEREFEEETGIVPQGPFVPLGSVVQANRKLVHAWAFAGDWDPEVTPLRSNTFEIEWPPRSGRMRAFPEVDQARFFTPAAAERMLIPAQLAFVTRLAEWLAGSGAVETE